MPDKHPERGEWSDIIIMWILGEPRAWSWKGRRCPHGLPPPLFYLCDTFTHVEFEGFLEYSNPLETLLLEIQVK